MSTHTLGPWSVDEEFNFFMVRAPSGTYGAAKGPCVACVYMIGAEPGDEEANARLIAAAPSMYDAIREALENCETCRDDGQPNCCRCLTFASIVRCIDGEEAQL